MNGKPAAPHYWLGRPEPGISFCARCKARSNTEAANIDCPLYPGEWFPGVEYPASYVRRIPTTGPDSLRPVAADLGRIGGPAHNFGMQPSTDSPPAKRHPTPEGIKRLIAGILMLFLLFGQLGCHPYGPGLTGAHLPAPEQRPGYLPAYPPAPGKGWPLYWQAVEHGTL